MSKLVTIIGGSGFIGRQAVRELAPLQAVGSVRVVVSGPDSFNGAVKEMLAQVRGMDDVGRRAVAMQCLGQQVHRSAGQHQYGAVPVGIMAQGRVDRAVPGKQHQRIDARGGEFSRVGQRIVGKARAAGERQPLFRAHGLDRLAAGLRRRSGPDIGDEPEALHRAG